MGDMFGGTLGGGGSSKSQSSGGGLGGMFGDSGGSAAPAPTSAPAAKKGGGGFFHDVGQLGKNLAGNIASTAEGIVPAAYTLGKASVEDERDLLTGHGEHANRTWGLVKAMGDSYKNYYGHDVAHHLFTNPLQPVLDVLSIADLGVGAAAKAGEVANVSKLAKLGERGELVTRSPRRVYQGEGPKVTEVTSTKPIRNLREAATKRITAAKPEARLAMRGRPGGVLGVQGELTRYGKTISDATTRNAFQKLKPFDQYAKVVKRLSGDELTALHLRAQDIHPDDLAEVWKDTPDEEELTPKVKELMLNPSKKMLAAEPVFRAFSQSGAELLKSMGKLSQESERDRPGLAKREASKILGRPVRPITGEPYYFPHTHIDEAPKGSNPLSSVGGGKGPTRRLGSTRRNRGTLFTLGKVKVRGDVLGSEYLRRVKYIKFSEIHQALTDAAPRYTYDEIQEMPRGTIPKGWTYMRQDASTRVPFNIRPEGRVGLEADEAAAPSSTELARAMPDPGNLQSSKLVKHGFTTDDINDPNVLTDEQGRYYMIPKATAKAATGEFTRMGGLAYVFNKYPVRIWRALLLGTRPAFLVNNMVGNGLMYATKVGGTGALRDFVMAVAEHHGWRTAETLLDDPVTPPALRAQLTHELHLALTPSGLSRAEGSDLIPNRNRMERATFGAQEIGDEPVPRQPVAPPPEQSFYERHYPEQMPIHGSFGFTQVPGSEGYMRDFAGRTGRAFGTATGAIPKLTAYAAEGTLRRGLIRNFVRRSPEFRAVYNALPKDIRSFETAAEKLHSGEGGIAFQRMISKEVDRSLGNYTRLGPAERGALRTIFPFYAWYRAILSTVFHLATDNPIRLNALHLLGQIGQQTMSNTLFPSFLRGSISLGAGPHGTERLLTTAGLNPWSTLTQLIQGSSSDIGQLGINPFFEGAMQEYAKETAHGGTASPLGILGHSVESIFSGLPTSQVIDPKGPSALYPNRGRGDWLQRREAAFEAWLGAPIKEVSPNVAAADAAAGQ